MRKMRELFLLLMLPVLLFPACSTKKDDVPRRLEILLLGHKSEHHNSQQLAEILSREYFKEGINITYTTDPDFLTRDDLALYDGLLLYASRDSLSKAQEQGLRDFVASGKGVYTDFGHDERKFNNPDFLQVVKNGMLHAVSDEARTRLEQFTLAEPEYEPGKMPNYEERDPPPLYQHALTPEESMSLIQVPVGFELELFASEPDIINPIAMTWDERGRLWVIETEDYPNTVRDAPRAGNDRIKICEDTDGDGRADKFTVFADSLNIPTSLVFAGGGLIVSQAPHFLFLQDTDGDDKADVREVLFDGWGTWDTHAGPSNLKYGMDNKVWGTVGYAGFEGRLGGKKMKFGSGLYRFRPDGKEFEYLAPTTNNTWGLGFSEEFDVFLSTANNEHSDHFAIPNRFYELAGLEEKGIEKIDGHYEMHVVTKNLRQVDVHGGFTAAAGHNLYTARAFPREYWNRIAFVCEPTGRIIHKAILEQQGSGFEEKDGWNFAASADEWFGPVHAEVGPDGALWVLDWYNFIIQHNPTPEGFETGVGNAYIDSLREYTRGRIYRISYKDAPDYDPVALSREEPEELVRTLGHDNMFWRLTAQRLLVETGSKEVAGELLALVRNKEVDEAGINAGAMHALWTLHGLGLMNGNNREALDAAFAALEHPAAGVRKAAIQVLPRSEEARESLLASGLLDDPDMRVRLAALLALAEMPSSARVGKALDGMAGVPENAEDKWVSHALRIARKLNQAGFTEAGTRDGTSVAAGDLAGSADPVADQEAPALDKATPAADKATPDKPVDQVIRLSAVVNQMKYDKELLTLKAGSTVKIVFSNPDHMQHNLLIIAPGSLEKVGAAADKLAQDPNGASSDYIPEMPEILFTTPLVDPQSIYELVFEVPETPGEYPFVCTFPGHWRIMNGIMKVE